jgi:hypothetical protein
VRPAATRLWFEHPAPLVRPVGADQGPVGGDAEAAADAMERPGDTGAERGGDGWADRIECGLGRPWFPSIEVHAIAAPGLGRIARPIGGLQHRGHRPAVRRHWDDADAGSHRKPPAGPSQAVPLDLDSNPLRNAVRFGQGTMLQQEAELVAAKTGQRVTLPELARENGAEAPEQGIAGIVPADIVDFLEVVEVQVQERVV